jgi:hypothetical protein
MRSTERPPPTEQHVDEAAHTAGVTFHVRPYDLGFDVPMDKRIAVDVQSTPDGRGERVVVRECDGERQWPFRRNRAGKLEPAYTDTPPGWVDEAVLDVGVGAVCRA